MQMKNLFWLMLLLAALVCFGCTSAPKPQSHRQLESYRPSGFSQAGEASYYSDKLQGRSTASGEPYDKNALTAAHRKLAFGTKVRVTNKANGQSVVVRINDRGPYAKGRIIDLSRAAFSAIGNTSAGVMDVTLEVVR